MILVCGKREAEEGTVNMRRLGSRDQASMTLDEAIARLSDEAKAAGSAAEGPGGGRLINPGSRKCERAGRRDGPFFG